LFSTIDGVEYARWETLAARCVTDRPDVLVAVRFWEAIAAVRLAPLQIFWTGDAYDQPYLNGLSAVAASSEIDLFMLQSDWQIETFRTHHRVPASHIVRTTLGAATAPLAPLSRVRRERRLAYASTPFRGLDMLLEVFPQIRAACPDATLEIYSSMQVYGVSAADDRKQFDAVYRKAKQPGVTLVGSVSQPVLAERLRTARILAYPNSYEETFCIAAAEAQAAGCVVVTSALGALPETVGAAGVCIGGRPGSAAYRKAFVDACIALLKDDARWEAMSAHAAAQAAERFSWPRIAEHWEHQCRMALTDEPVELERVFVHLAAGRAGLAYRMLSKIPQPAGVSNDTWISLTAFVASEAGEASPPPPAAIDALALYFRSLRRSGALSRIALEEAS
jgi:glycosyltransferase involved in cell wall biosynthesis